MKRWQSLARQSGHALAQREATLDDYRGWYCSARRYHGDVDPALPLDLDLRARWWSRWFPWWPA